MSQVTITACTSIVCPTVLLHTDARPPARAEDFAAGHDICCVGGLEGLEYPEKWSEEQRDQWLQMAKQGYVTLAAGEGFLFRTGFAQQIDPGYECILFDRSSLGAIQQVHRFAGVIDPSYRGEWFVRLHNHSRAAVRIRCGDRIVQGVYLPRVQADCPVVSQLPTSLRGAEGFGSTNKAG